MQCRLSSKQIYSAMTFYSSINWTATIGIDVKYHEILQSQLPMTHLKGFNPTESLTQLFSMLKLKFVVISVRAISTVPISFINFNIHYTLSGKLMHGNTDQAKQLTAECMYHIKLVIFS